MSRPFITADGIDVAGMLKGDRFVDLIEYKGSELSTHADTTGTIIPLIEANTQLIYDTSGILQVQIDSIAGLTSTVVTRGSNYVHLNTAGSESYPDRYMIPDDVDVLVIDTGNAGTWFAVELQSTRTKQLQIIHENVDNAVFIYNGNDDWYHDTAVFADTYLGSGRPVLFTYQGFSGTFEKVNAEGGGPAATWKVTKHGFGDQLIKSNEIHSNIRGLPTFRDSGSDPVWEDSSYLLRWHEWNGIIGGVRKAVYNFSSDSQTQTISTSQKANKTVPGASYIVQALNTLSYSSVTLNMPSSKAVGDTYIVALPSGSSITVSGNGSNFSGNYGTVASWQQSGVSHAITWNGSTWDVGPSNDQAWANLGISSGGAFYGDVAVRNAEFNAWKSTVSNTCIGEGAGQLHLITGISNTLVGNNAGTNLTSGTNNVILGASAGLAIASGGYNVAIGNNALQAASASNTSIAIGSSAMGGATAADKCVAVGRVTLYSNTTGIQNVGLGDRVGYFNTTGSNNIGIGTEALLNKQIGSLNIAIGQNAMNGFAGTSATYQSALNIGIGPESLFNIRTGSRNIAIGYQTLYASGSYQDADYNIAMGYQAGYTGLGIGNVAIGYAAANNSGTGATYNVAIGYNSDIVSGHDQGVAVGRQAISRTDSVTIGAYSTANDHSSVAVGANSDANLYAVAVGMYAQATTNYTIAIGGGSSAALSANATGIYAIAIGYDSLADQQDSICIGRATNVGGSGAIAMGYLANAGGIRSVAIGRSAGATSPYSTVIGYSASSNTTQGYDTLIGYNTSSSGSWGHNIAIGESAVVGTNYSIAIGVEANADQAIAIGHDTSTSASGAIGIGDLATCWNQGGIALGILSHANGSIAIGKSSRGDTGKNIAIGEDTTSSSTNGIAIGRQSTVDGTAGDSVAIGYLTHVTHENAVVFGRNCDSQWDNTFHIGDTTAPMDLYVSGNIIGTINAWEIVDGTSFTAQNNYGYFVDATAALNVDMPASPKIGDAVWFDDFKGQSGTNNITVRANGGGALLLEGVSENLTIDVNGALIKLTYVDGTFGWRYKVV